MKKFLLTITALLTAACSFAFDSGYLSYTIIDSEKKECSVSGYNAETIPTNLFGIVLPGEVTDNGITYSVVRIDENAFKDAPINGVKIPNGVTTIQQFAFRQCKSLRWIDLPESLTECDRRAFSGCINLHSANIRCNIEPENILVSNVIYFVYYFETVRKLNSQRMPSRVTNIVCHGNTPPETTSAKFDPQFGFHGIVNVPSGAIPAYRAAEGWKDCRLFVNDLTQGGITYMITDAAKHECQVAYGDNYYEGVEDLVIPSVVTIKGEDYSVTSIADKAFYESSNITSLTIPATVREIGEDFVYSARLERITVESGSPYFKDIDGILYTADNSTLIKCPKLRYGHFDVPDGVRTISAKAFYTTGITSINLPNTLSEIGQGAFSFCYNLSKVTIPSSVTKMGRSVFSCCYYLQFAKVESEVVGASMFHYCWGLRTLILGTKVKKIEKWALEGVGVNGFTVYSLGTTPPTCEEELTFDNPDSFYKRVTLKVPYESKDAYANHPIFGKINAIKNTLGSDASGLTYDTNLFGGSSCGPIYVDREKAAGDFVVPDKVTVGGTTHNVSSSLRYVFEDNDALTSLTLPSSSMRIIKAIAPGSANICEYKSSIDNFHFTEGILTYGTSDPWVVACVPGKSGDVTIDQTDILDYAFYGCDKITSVTFKKPIFLGRHIFDGCTAIEEVNVSSEGGSLYDDLALSNNSMEYAFANCTGLKKVTLKTNTIGMGAFINCKSLEEVTIEPYNKDSSKSICKDVFLGCPNLKSITCRSTEPFVAYNQFDFAVDILESNRYSDVTLYVPEGSAQAYKQLLPWKNFRNIVEKDMGGVDDISAEDSSSVSVCVSAGTIIVAGVEPDAVVSVYDLFGRSIYSGKSNEITPGSHGIYIVAVSGKTFKVAL